MLFTEQQLLGLGMVTLPCICSAAPALFVCHLQGPLLPQTVVGEQLKKAEGRDYTGDVQLKGKNTISTSPTIRSLCAIYSSCIMRGLTAFCIYFVTVYAFSKT